MTTKENLQNESDIIIPWHFLAMKVPLYFPDTAEVLNQNSPLIDYSADFGGTARFPPRAVLRPRTAADIVTAMRFSQQYRVPVAVRGAGHAASRLVLRRGGLIIDMRSLPIELSINVAAGYIDISGGATWAAVIKATLAQGLMPKTTVDWQELTVAGTISTGGVGAQSFWAGVHADQVMELELISGAGEEICCSPTQDAAVFDAARAGLGQVGAMVRVRMPLVAAPRQVRLHELYYTSVGQLLTDLRVFIRDRRFDTLLVVAVPRDVAAQRLSEGNQRFLQAPAGADATSAWVFKLDAGKYEFSAPSTVPLASHQGISDTPQGRLLSTEEFLFRAPPLMQRKELYAAPHPELILFVPDHAAEELIQTTIAALPIGDMGGGPILLLPIEFGQVRAPLLQVPKATRGFMFSLLRVAAPATESEISRLTANNLQIYARALECGATRYPCDALPFAPIPADYWEHRRELQQRLDPAQVLAVPWSLSA